MRINYFYEHFDTMSLYDGIDVTFARVEFDNGTSQEYNIESEFHNDEDLFEDYMEEYNKSNCTLPFEDFLKKICLIDNGRNFEIDFDKLHPDAIDFPAK